MKNTYCMIVAVCMVTGCYSTGARHGSVQQLSEGPIQLHDSSSKVLRDNQNVALKLIWQAPKGTTSPVEGYPTAKLVEKWTGQKNIVQILVPGTPFAALVSRTSSGIMIWDKERAELWKAEGYPFRGAKHRLWFFETTSQRITVFFGDDAYGYKWHLDFSDSEIGLRFDFDMWTGY